MRVLFVASDISYPPTDGSKIVIYNTLRAVAELGHEVALAGFASPDGLVPDETADRFRISSYLADLKSRPFGMLRSLFYATPYNYAKCHSPGFVEQAHRAAHAFRPDVIQVDGLNMGTCGLALARRRGIPVILRAHNVDSVLMSRFRDSQRNALVRAYADLQARRTLGYERRHVPEFDRCVAITKVDAEALRRIAGVGVDTISAGVDTEYFLPRQELEEPWSLVSAALMRWLPNVISVRWFLEWVFPLIRRDVPAARFYVIGKDPPDDIRRRHDGRSVVVTGYVPDIRPWVARGSVFVVPTVVGSGMRMKVIEALAMGKAIVSTELGCEGIEGLSDGVNVMLADSAADFARAVVRLLGDSELRQGLGEAGRRLVVDNFRWSDVSRKLALVYEQAVSAGPRARDKAV